MEEKVKKCKCSTEVDLVVDGRYLFKHSVGTTYLFDAVVVELTKYAIRLRFKNNSESWYLKEDFYKEYKIVEVLYEPPSFDDILANYFGSYPVFKGWYIRSS